MAAEPLTVIVPVPSPVTTTLAVEPSVSRPLVPESVTVSVSPSASATVIALPLALENTSVVSSLVDCPGGTTVTGGSLTATTPAVTVVVSVTPPDVTV